MHPRIIARLDIKGPNLVKGVHLEGLRVLGRPEDFARYYYETGADELLYQDIVASLYGRNSLHDVISKTARGVFIPLAVGGGLRSVEDIRSVLKAGADKVVLNTAAIKNPEFITAASRRFGSSTIVVAIECIRQADGGYLAYTDNGREFTGRDAISWAVQAEELGAGELVVTSVDREGTGTGFDLTLTKLVTSKVSIPVIAHGGAGQLQDIRDVIVEGGADAVAVASMLHYNAITTQYVSADETLEGNRDFLKGRRTFQVVEARAMNEIKQFLSTSGIACRNGVADRFAT